MWRKDSTALGSHQLGRWLPFGTHSQYRCEIYLFVESLRQTLVRRALFPVVTVRYRSCRDFPEQLRARGQERFPSEALIVFRLAPGQGLPTLLCFLPAEPG